MIAQVLGGHLVHVLVFGAWGLAVAVVLVWPTGASRARAESGEATGSDRSWLQGAFLGLCAAAITHASVMPDHFAQSWLYGAFFLCAAAAQLGAAWAVIVRPSRRLLGAIGAGSLAVVVLWAVSRFVGVPVGPDDGAVEPLGVLDVLATVAELLTSVACAVVLVRGTVRPAWRWRWWGLPLRLALLATGVGVPLAAALSSRG